MRAIRRIMHQIEEILRKNDSLVLENGELWSKMFNSKFENREAERLRMEFVVLNRFQESWIPSLKRGGFSRFELYNLAEDPSQETDIVKRYPDIVRRLSMQALEISESVMADAPIRKYSE